jgi:hypothetical protein
VKKSTKENEQKLDSKDLFSTTDPDLSRTEREKLIENAGKASSKTAKRQSHNLLDLGEFLFDQRQHEDSEIQAQALQSSIRSNKKNHEIWTSHRALAAYLARSE